MANMKSIDDRYDQTYFMRTGLPISKRNEDEGGKKIISSD
jgi:hypothetical protein